MTTLTIETTPDELTIDVVGLGECTFTELTRSGEERLARHLGGLSHRVNYSACVDELISACLSDRSLPPAAVSRLPPKTRGRLRLAALRVVGAAGYYKRLAGSHLTLDERAYAALRERRRRHDADLRELLRRRARERDGRMAVDSDTVRLPAQTKILSTLRSAAGLNRTLRVLTGAQFVKPLDLGTAEHLRRNIAGIGGVDQLRTKLAAVQPAASATSAAPSLAAIIGDAGLTPARRLALANITTEFGRSRPTHDVLASYARSQRPLFDDHIRTLAAEVNLDLGQRFSESVLKPTSLALAYRTSLIPRFEERFAALARPAMSIDLSHAKALQGLAAFPSVQSLVRRSLQIADRRDFVVVVYHQLRERLADSPLSFLVELLDRAAAIALMRIEYEQGMNAAVDALTPAVSSTEVLEALEAGIAQAPHLSRLARRWLLRALAEASDGNWEMAIPDLDHGIEAAFRDGARSDGLILYHKSRDHIVDHDGSPRLPVNSAGILFQHLELEEDRRDFLRRKAYDHDTNQYRHGVIHEGNESDDACRRHSVVLLLALAIWLDMHVDGRALDAISNEIETRIGPSPAGTREPPALN